MISRSNITDSEYYGSKALGSSALKLAAADPAMYYKRYVVGELPFKQTASMRTGSVLDAMLLYRKDLPDGFVIKPDFGGKGSVAARKEWESANDNKTHVTRSEVESAKRMYQSVEEPKTPAAEFVNRMVFDTSAEKQFRHFWTRDEIDFRCALDLLCENDDGRFEFEFKSTKDPRVAPFTRDRFNLGYDVQRTLYREGAAAAGLPLTGQIYAAIGNQEPYSVYVHPVLKIELENGALKLEKAIANIKRCQESGVWCTKEELGVAPEGQPPLYLLEPELRV